MTMCTFIDNTSIDNGGGMWVAGDAMLDVTDCQWSGNLAGDNGGAMLKNAPRALRSSVVA